jgi:hypothetical protein
MVEKGCISQADAALRGINSVFELILTFIAQAIMIVNQLIGLDVDFFGHAMDLKLMKKELTSKREFRY